MRIDLDRALTASRLDTPLGPVIVVGDEHVLHAVEYAENEELDRQIARIQRSAGAGIVPGRSAPVAQANGANPFAIVIPCHRVINTGGKAGGYGGGLPRKLWLLEHERRMTGGIENIR